MILEPIAEYSGMLMALKMAKFPLPLVANAVKQLEDHARSVPMSDPGAWIAIYRGALALIQTALQMQERVDQKKAADKQAAAERQRIGALRQAVPLGLQKAATEWPGRLATQFRELDDKLQRSVEKLACQSAHDEIRGETVFTLDSAQWQALLQWLDDAEAQWFRNNSELVAVRANETLADALAEAGGFSFRVAPLAMQRPSSPPPSLKGFSAPTPGKLSSVGATYKVVMSAVMGVSALGFFVSRTFEQVKLVLPILSGAVFLGAIVYAVVTVPKKQKQALARLDDKAHDQVRREAYQVLRSRIERFRDQQLDLVKKHLLGTEARRAAQAVREATGDPRALPDGLDLMMGLMPQDVAKLRGEWRVALERRIDTLARG